MTTSRIEISSAQRSRERALVLTLFLDSVIVALLIGLAVASGSVTLAAEALRAFLLFVLGVFALRLMKRVHRGNLANYDFGTAKIEQFANLLVAIAMLLSAAWLIMRTAAALRGPDVPLDEAMLAGAVVSLLNLMVNAFGFWALWRSGRDGSSLVMRGQIRSRLGKLVVSCLVTVTLGVASLASDTMLGRNADAVGGLVMAVVLALLAAGLLRDTLPDLLDRSLDEQRQIIINRVLGDFFDAYEELGMVRTRQAGMVVHIELTLGFAASRKFVDVNTTTKAIAAALRREIPGADVLVVPTLSGEEISL